ncbi:hypothetical protein LCGC14_2168760, partial [marine sediment metagenome]
MAGAGSIRRRAAWRTDLREGPRQANEILRGFGYWGRQRDGRSIGTWGQVRRAAGGPVRSGGAVQRSSRLSQRISPD